MVAQCPWLVLKCLQAILCETKGDVDFESLIMELAPRGACLSSQQS